MNGDPKSDKEGSEETLTESDKNEAPEFTKEEQREQREKQQHRYNFWIALFTFALAGTAVIQVALLVWSNYESGRSADAAVVAANAANAAKATLDDARNSSAASEARLNAELKALQAGVGQTQRIATAAGSNASASASQAETARKNLTAYKDLTTESVDVAHDEATAAKDNAKATKDPR